MLRADFAMLRLSRPKNTRLPALRRSGVTTMITDPVLPALLVALET